MHCPQDIFSQIDNKVLNGLDVGFVPQKVHLELPRNAKPGKRGMADQL